jgi:hypothetical protein
MRRKYRYGACLAATLALSGACAGSGGDDNTSGAGGNGGSTGGMGGSGTGGVMINMPSAAGLSLFDASRCMSSGSPGAGSTPVRRLSRVEYNNMVRDLGLGDTRPADQFVAEQKIPGNFNTNAYASVSGTLINQQYLQTAETLAEAAATSTNTLSSLLAPSGSACNTRNAACAQAFIADFAGRAFRGQLDDGESAALLQLYNDTAAQFDFATGIQAVITSVLSSPRFLFVLEFGQSGSGSGASGSIVPLAPMELASRLALFLWRSLPDATLMQAASSGNVDVTAQATRMLADTRATAALQDFANQWLEIENMDAVTKDTQFTYWTADLAKELHTETLTTFSSSLLMDNTDLKTLLTSSSSYVNADLATYYSTGKPGTALGTSYTKTAVGSSSSPRTGILTQGAVMASHAHTSLPSPTLRGRMIRQQVLCEQVPDPPAEINGMPIPPPPSALTTGTTRDQYQQHMMKGSACQMCHQWMDPIGFGFDNFDATGNWYTQENGTNIDASGMFVAMNPPNDLTGSFTSAADMINQLAASQQTNQCFALQQMRYAWGRVETAADACSAQKIYQAFSSSNFNLKQLLLAVVTSDSFRYRTSINPGGACQ